MNGKHPNGNHHQEVTDAVHPRFRERYENPTLIVCVSCNENFPAQNIIQSLLVLPRKSPHLSQI
uniref:CSON008721 protein n=1 Tax=Culicoides sonorensis TaxID=179676 RepID=A0A336KG99_CULSO